jgi:GNAT superfamily N-acetyltransferase
MIVVVPAPVDGRVITEYRSLTLFVPLVGFTRTTLVAGMPVAYLYDVYVLDQHRGRGLGAELVRETVERGPFAEHRWLLDTRDAFELYAKFGFGPPSERLMERPRQMRDS